jgi:3-methyladenine DNA glycosylase Tag
MSTTMTDLSSTKQQNTKDTLILNDNRCVSNIINNAQTIARLTQENESLHTEILDWKSDNLVIERANGHLKDEIKRVTECSLNQAQHWYALTDNIQRANKYITDHETCDKIARDYKVRKDKEIVRLRAQKQQLLRIVKQMERTNAKNDKAERRLYEERMELRRQLNN